MACPKVDERFEKMYRDTLEGADSFSFENAVLTIRDNQAQPFCDLSGSRNRRYLRGT
jgi:hypothetical protein